MSDTDLVSIVESMIGMVRNERVASYNEGVDTERERCRAENERLRAALEPFQRNVDALSLSATLGHIDREMLWNARHAYEQPSGETDK